MTKDQSQKLLQFYDSGYSVLISMGYVDGEAHVYEATEATLEENAGFHKNLELGDICFNSDVYAQYPLKDVSVSDVKVFKEVDEWFNEDAIIETF